MPKSIKIYIVAVHNCAACALSCAGGPPHHIFHMLVFRWLTQSGWQSMRGYTVCSAVYADGVCHDVAFSLSIKPTKEARR